MIVKTLINLENEKSINDFSAILTDNFKSSLSTVINKEVNITLTDVANYDTDEILSDFKEQVFIMVSEQSNELNGGLLVKIQDATALVDFMMMGDGSAKDSIDDEDKDGIKELFTQMISSINVPVNETFDATVSFAVDGVELAVDNLLDMFSTDQFFAINAVISFDDFSIPFRFFIEESFTFLLGAGLSDASEADNLSQDFTFPDDDEEDMMSPVKTEVSGNIDMLLDVEIPVSVKIGSTRMFLKDIVALGPGNIVELEEYADEPVELTINNKVIARGEVVIVDGYFGLRIKEIVSREERLQKLKD